MNLQSWGDSNGSEAIKLAGAELTNTLSRAAVESIDFIFSVEELISVNCCMSSWSPHSLWSTGAVEFICPHFVVASSLKSVHSIWHTRSLQLTWPWADTLAVKDYTFKILHALMLCVDYVSIIFHIIGTLNIKHNAGIINYAVREKLQISMICLVIN